MGKIITKLEDFVLYGLKGIPWDVYLFVLFTFPRVFNVMILGGIFDISGTIQHETLTFEKYSYAILLVYMVVYEITYLLRYKRLRFNVPQILGIVFFLFAVFTTAVNMGRDLAYDYFTKLSLGELMMTAVFILNIGSKLKEKLFVNFFSFLAESFLLLNMFMNVVSVLSICLYPNGGVIPVLGIPVTLPVVLVDPNPWRMHYRYAGFYSNASTLGIACYFAVLLTIILLDEKKISRTLGIVCILVNLGMILVSNSRMALINIGVIAIIFLSRLLHQKKNYTYKRIFGSFVLLCLALGLILCLLRMDLVTDVLARLKADPFWTIDDLTSARLQLARAAINHLKARPLIGVGWNVTFDVPNSVGSFNHHGSAHNFILTILAWTGILGTLIECAFIWSAHKKFQKNSPLIKAHFWLFCLIICVTIQCLFEQGMVGDARHANTYLFWLVLGFFISDRDQVPLAEVK